MKINHQSDYAARRRKEYPSIEDQMDALWKGGEEAEAMRAKVIEVKQRYPKPQGTKT